MFCCHSIPHLKMSQSPSPFWGRKTFCVVTGASQGIGRQLSVDFSRNLGDGSVMLLLARSVPGMEETQRLIQAANPRVKVTLRSADLARPNADEFTDFIRSSLAKFDAQPKDFGLAMLVHNAGSVGDVSERASEMLDAHKMADYLSLNVVSVTCLTAVFLHVFPADATEETCVVNVTSLCAIQPFKSMGYYCVGKASREMYFRVLAKESPHLNVLSYSPGPVDTAMVSEVIDRVADGDVRNQFVEIKANILTPEQTAKKCIRVLADRKYKSGDRVDYFDEGF